MTEAPENIYDPDFVKLMFDRMSASYERMNYITSFGFCIRWRRQALKELSACPHKVMLLDLLAGMGETWSAVKKKYPSSQITAIDFSKEMIRSAKQRNKRYFNSEVSILEQNFLDNQLPGEHYDRVICAYGLKTFNNSQLQVVAREVYRILKEGGEFSFVEVSKPANQLLGVLYAFYLRKIIPVLGKLFLGNPEAYQMLWHYTDRFGNAKKTVEVFRNAGLTCTYKSYFFGCATGFYGKK